MTYIFIFRGIMFKQPTLETSDGLGWLWKTHIFLPSGIVVPSRSSIEFGNCSRMAPHLYDHIHSSGKWIRQTSGQNLRRNRTNFCVVLLNNLALKKSPAARLLASP